MPDPQRHVTLAPLCAAAAAGRRDAIEPAARGAISAGCTAEEIREALLTLAPFCGFPRALDALAAAGPVIGASPERIDETDAASTIARGRAFFDCVYGRDAARVRSNLETVDAEVAAWIERDAYGNVLSRPGISASLRERIAVVLLAAQGLRNQLSGHLRGALNCGASAAEVAEFLAAAAPFIDPAESTFARETLRRVVG